MHTYINIYFVRKCKISQLKIPLSHKRICLMLVEPSRSLVTPILVLDKKKSFPNFCFPVYFYVPVYVHKHVCMCKSHTGRLIQLPVKDIFKDMGNIHILKFAYSNVHTYIHKYLHNCSCVCVREYNCVSALIYSTILYLYFKCFYVLGKECRCWVVNSATLIGPKIFLLKITRVMQYYY